MPRVSRIPVDQKLAKDIEENFLFLVSTLHRPEVIQQFFSDFLTNEEKTMLSKRLMLHLMLEKGYKQSEIQSAVRMSRESIRVHESKWSRGSRTYKLILRKLVDHARDKEFWVKVEKALKPLELFVKARHDMKARAKFLSGEFD
ncbi:MAG: hypothetical protein HYV40_05085 [Candidatus Levybacteria bacterium]|nr:hypothetical protein [Candidatus Levybacteria bacterium]